ncbi:hypothetical protein HFN_2291 [Helicobacter fennelliae MRY12-0050]|uniref:Uncharacterized protein n=1 Tax=Helicobacter fennelliae MRY12-0050 TaxID=1325130 RepID=T1DV18_9HELI|nr:hypothetical protein HFN_2291 [Helicobacter fennelliae MRY12-0050]
MLYLRFLHQNICYNTFFIIALSARSGDAGKKSLYYSWL